MRAAIDWLVARFSSANPSSERASICIHVSAAPGTQAAAGGEPQLSTQSTTGVADAAQRRLKMASSCTECGKGGTTGPGGDLRKCGRCHSVQYCSVACQTSSWASTHKSECKNLAKAQGEGRALAKSERARGKHIMAPAPNHAQPAGVDHHCYICFESEPTPVHPGCGCRNGAGRVHPACCVAVAESKGSGDPQPWMCCTTCLQPWGPSAVKNALAQR